MTLVQPLEPDPEFIRPVLAIAGVARLIPAFLHSGLFPATPDEDKTALVPSYFFARAPKSRHVRGCPFQKAGAAALMARSSLDHE
jgi:hypothetical protein